MSQIIIGIARFKVSIMKLAANEVKHSLLRIVQKTDASYLLPLSKG